MLYIIIILIIISAISKALVDTIAFHQGGVFKGNNFFDITKQGKMFPLTKYPMDGFHIANSLMILSFIVAVCIPSTIPWWIKFSLLSVIFIITFNIFWNHIFNNKNKSK